MYLPLIFAKFWCPAFAAVSLLPPKVSLFSCRWKLLRLFILFSFLLLNVEVVKDDEDDEDDDEDEEFDKEETDPDNSKSDSSKREEL